jgi:GT2 family glycosyltransferase
MVFVFARSRAGADVPRASRESPNHPSTGRDLDMSVGVSGQAGKAPSVSIIVPAIDPCPGLPTLLARLASLCQGLEQAAEIIIVDNTSTGSAYIRQAATSWDVGVSEVRFHVLRETHGHSYSARNRGIAEASGTHLVFLDSDVRPTDRWLGGLGMVLRDAGIQRATGPVRQVVSTPARFPWDRWAQTLDLLTGLPQRIYAAHGWGATANLVVRREVIDHLGAFDPSLESSGDREFGMRAERAGVPLAFVPELEVEHEARGSLRELLRKARRVARGHATLLARWGKHEYRERLGRLWRPWSYWMRLGAKVVLRTDDRSVSRVQRFGAALVSLFLGLAATAEYIRTLHWRRDPSELNP